MSWAMWIRPSTPKVSAAQPITWRPGGPLRSGWRSVRQATASSSTGTAQPSTPTEPATTVRTPPATSPGRSHQTAAATTTASPTKASPTPSRRCSGARSRAVEPMLRASAPSRCATPSQSARRLIPIARNNRVSSPGPRFFDDRERGFGRGFDRAELRLVRPDVRERVLVEDFFDLDALRDRGGEVRVATSAGYVLTPRVTRVTRRHPRTFRDQRLAVARSAAHAVAPDQRLHALRRSAARGCAISGPRLHDQRPTVARSAAHGCAISGSRLHDQRLAVGGNWQRPEDRHTGSREAGR